MMSDHYPNVAITDNLVWMLIHLCIMEDFPTPYGSLDYWEADAWIASYMKGIKP